MKIACSNFNSFQFYLVEGPRRWGDTLAHCAGVNVFVVKAKTVNYQL